MLDLICDPTEFGFFKTAVWSFKVEHSHWLTAEILEQQNQCDVLQNRQPSPITTGHLSNESVKNLNYLTFSTKHHELQLFQS